MNPESLPSALSDLFLPEVSNPAAKSGAGRDGQGTSPAPAADADRFEQYLSSARRSVMTDHALPAPAGPDEHLAVRADSRRRPEVDRTDRRQDRSITDRDERRPIDDRAADAAEREGPSVDRDRSDRSDDHRVGDGNGHQRSDDRHDTSDDRGEGAGDVDAAEASTGEESQIDSATDGSAAALAAAGLDLALDVDVDGAEGDSDELVGTVDPAAETEAAELDTDTGSEVDDASSGVDNRVDASLLDAQLDLATGPNPAPIAAAAATTDADDLDRVGTDDLAIDLDGAAAADADLAGEAATPDGDEAEAEAGVDLDLDLTDGSGDTDGGADDGIQPSERSTTASTDGGRPPSQGTTADGPTVAPIAGPVAATTSGQAATTGQTATGVDAVVGPAAPRNRSTTGPTSTQAGQQAQAPLADGEAGDPLWLQVRRAMGSLRTLQNGEQQMTIRLRPAELGSVMVRVNTGESGTTVSLIADSAVAATQLTQQRQQLISELEQGGLAGVAVDVGTGAETDLRDGAAEDRDPSKGSEGDGTAAAAAGAGTSAGLPRTGGRGRRPGGSSGSLVDVEL